MQDASRVRLEGEYDRRSVAGARAARGLPDDMLVPAMHSVEIAHGQRRPGQRQLLRFQPRNHSHDARIGGAAAFRNRPWAGVGRCLSDVDRGTEQRIIGSAMDTAKALEQVDVTLCIDREVYLRLWEVIRHLCVGLVDLNAKVRLLSSYPGAEALTLGPIQTIVHEELNWPFRRQRLDQLVEALSVRKPTIVHAFSAGTYWVGRRLADAFGVDLVVQVTSTADVQGLERLNLERIPRIIAATAPLQQMLPAAGRVSAETVSLIRPGVLRSEEPTCFGNPDRVPTVLCTAALDSGSGVRELVLAVRLLRERGCRLLLFLLGRGRRERELRKLAHEQNVSDWITFARPRADTLSVMSGADIWVAPAAEQSVVSESLVAMASGTAVVACAEAVADHYVHGITAVVCPDGEPASLADGIEQLLLDKQKARHLAGQAIAHMKEHHGVSNMAERTMSLYQQLSLRRRTFSMPR